MADFNSSVSVNASPEDVFAFVSDVSNLPKYLPTVKNVHTLDGDRIAVQGRAGDDTYNQDGFFRASGGNRLEWGSDGDKDYHGAMDISGDDGMTTVSVMLHLNPPPQDAGQIEENAGEDWKSQMQEGVERCLQSIKNHLEGTGGKDEIPESQ